MEPKRIVVKLPDSDLSAEEVAAAVEKAESAEIPEEDLKAAEEAVADAVAVTNQQSRAKAMALLATMPDWWKEKVRAVARKHGYSRAGRRGVKAVLRAYESWSRRTTILRARQAAERDARNEDLALRIHARAEAGLPPPRGVSADVLARFHVAADQHA